jgi:hypothetical protein
MYCECNSTICEYTGESRWIQCSIPQTGAICNRFSRLLLTIKMSDMQGYVTTYIVGARMLPNWPDHEERLSSFKMYSVSFILWEDNRYTRKNVDFVTNQFTFCTCRGGITVDENEECSDLTAESVGRSGRSWSTDVRRLHRLLQWRRLHVLWHI